MSATNNHSFSIENIINDSTKAPYGNKYHGSFNIRRPSLQDRNMADIRKAAILNAFGNAGDMVGEWTKSSVYIYCLVSQIATEKLPSWFDYAQMFDDEDEDAIMAVWAEVQKFIDSFRPKTSS